MSAASYADMRARSTDGRQSLSEKGPRKGRGAPPNPYLMPVAQVPSHGGFSGLLRKQGAGNSAWKLRYFVLPRDTDRLLWYEDKHMWHAEPAKPHRAVRIVGLGSTNMDDGGGLSVFEVWATELESSDSPGKARGSIVTRMIRRINSSNEAPQKGSACYRLAAASAAEATAWVAALNACLQAEQRVEQRVEQPATRTFRKPDSSQPSIAADRDAHGSGNGDVEAPVAAHEAPTTADTAAAEEASPTDRGHESDAPAPAVVSSGAPSPRKPAQPPPTVDVTDTVSPPPAASSGGAASSRGRDVSAADARVDGERGGEGDGEEEEEEEEAEAAALEAAREKAATAFAEALRLCKQSSRLSDADEAALVQLAAELPAAFVVPDPSGIAPIHWLCGSSAPSTDALDELLERLPTAAQCVDRRGCVPLHWLAANAAVSAELLLLVLESHEAAAAHADAFGQLPLHWLCMGSSAADGGDSDARTLPLLLDAHAAAVSHADHQGRTPLHVLCRSAAAADESALRALLDADKTCARVQDKSGQTPLHIVCGSPGVCAPLLTALLDAHAASAAVSDIDGHVPLHYLTRTRPAGGELWQLLIAHMPKVDEAARGQPFDHGGGSMARASSANAPPPVMVAGDGAVKGIRGRVKSVLHTGAGLETRNEDRGLLLFISSMSAVKVTADACRQAAALLDALLIEVDQRDVFVNAEYASQLRRLHAATLAQSGDDGAAAAAAAAASPGTQRTGRGLPELPKLYANGKLIGGLSELRGLDDEGKLVATLAPYRLDHQRGRELERRDCDECGGRRFLVCAECKGSRKGKLVFGKYLKCSYCNENGLTACPSCNNDGGKPVTANADE